MKKVVDSLNSMAILYSIEPQIQSFVSRLDIFESLDSTNTYLMKEAKVGAHSGTICFAEEQTAGRGRRGKTWVSPPGANLYCSVLWRFSSSTPISGLSIVIAIAVVKVLKKCSILAGLQLKWPNDVWFEGKKLSGILLEQTGENVVIGVGLNLNRPEGGDWISLQEITSQRPARNHLAGLLVNEIITQLLVYEAQGLKPFLSLWRELDILLGRSIEVHLPNEILRGTMKGLNDFGELLLLRENGELEAFSYGEVSIRMTT